MAVSTFVGATTAATLPWLLVPVVIVWAYVIGLMVSLGPRLSVAALQWSVGLLIAVGLPLGPAEATLRAGLVLAGGLLSRVTHVEPLRITPCGANKTVTGSLAV